MKKRYLVAVTSHPRGCPETGRERDLLLTRWLWWARLFARVVEHVLVRPTWAAPVTTVSVYEVVLVPRDEPEHPSEADLDEFLAREQERLR